MATKTARTLIAGAFHRMGLISEDEAPNADQSTRAFTILNDMLGGWEAEGIQYVYTDLATLDTTLDVPDFLLRSAEWLLADELADEYGKVLTQRQQMQVERARNSLQSYYFRPPVAQTDEGIIGRRVGTSTITFLRD